MRSVVLNAGKSSSKYRLFWGILILMGLVFMLNENAEASDAINTCSLVADYYDADTGEIIYTDIIENWSWEDSVVFTYEPRYTFYDEQNKGYVFDVQNEENRLMVTEYEYQEALSWGCTENLAMKIYYKQKDLAEGETAVKIRYMGYEPGLTGFDETLIGVTYVDGVKAGQSYVYQPELMVQPEKPVSIWRMLIFRFNENHEKNNLVLNTLSADPEDNVISVYYEAKESVPGPVGTLAVNYFDSDTGELLQQLTQVINVTQPFQYEPPVQWYKNEKLYEFDSANPGNVLSYDSSSIDGELKVYYQRVYNLTFSANGGSCIENSRKVKKGMHYGTLPTAIREGYTFEGWYTAKEGGSRITQDTVVNLTADQTLYARWSKVSVKRVSLQKPVSKRAGKMKITWKKVSGADGYQVTYAANKKFRKAKTRTVTKKTLTVKKMKKGKTYYVKIRAYKLDSVGEKVYGQYSRVRKVKIKK